MRNYYLQLLFVALTSSAYGQAEDYVRFDRDAYDKFVVKQIRYTVLNQNSTVSGLKVNIGKNEVTGTASLKSEDPIQTIDFSIASNTDGLFSLFGNGSFDSKFRIGYNYHHIPYWSHSVIPSGHPFAYRTARRAYEQKKQSLAMLRDTMVIMTALLKDVDPLFNLVTEFGPAHKDELAIIDWAASSWLANHRDPSVVGALSNSILKANDMDIDKPVDPVKLYQVLKSKVARYSGREETLTNDQIDLFGPFHTSSTLYWFTLSPSVEINPLKAFSAQYKLDDYFSVKATLRAQFNRLRHNSRRYALIRAGLQAGLTDNITQLTKETYAYSKTTTLAKNDSISITYQDKAEAYPLTSIKKGFGANVILEYFQVPAQTGSRLGYFISASPGINTTYAVGERFELPLEAGFVFSLLSDENKAIYLLPYVNFTNLLKFNQDNRLFKRDWLVGIKFALPFGLQPAK